MLIKQLLFFLFVCYALGSSSQDTLPVLKPDKIITYNSLEEIEVDSSFFKNYDQEKWWDLDDEFFMYDSINQIFTATIDNERFIFFKEDSVWVSLAIDEVSNTIQWGCDQSKIKTVFRNRGKRYVMLDFDCDDHGSSVWMSDNSIQVWSLTDRKLIFDGIYYRNEGSRSYDYFEKIDEETGEVYDEEFPCCDDDENTFSEFIISDSSIVVMPYTVEYLYTDHQNSDFNKKEIKPYKGKYERSVLKPGTYTLTNGKYIRTTVK